ncbi:hypothetical protein [Acinetobacter sp. YH01009]|uniref:hypothetical protein n=1 Tax=Acinetobacter TaxID=469 RepID=UPI0015D3B577|nr:hypothetical protein [Acinetobacter sp. YH01009]
MSNKTDDLKRKNINGSLSKTFNRKLKPISFCLSDPEQVELLEKIEKFIYGNYFKNIVGYLSNDDVNVIVNSNGKCEPIIPAELIELNMKKGFLSCRKIAKSLIKLKLVDSMLHELRNFISDDFITRLAEDRGLLNNQPAEINNIDLNTSSFEYEESDLMDSSYKMTPPPAIFNNQSLNIIKEIVRKHENLPPNIEIDNDFVQQFISENPELLSNL